MQSILKQKLLRTPLLKRILFSTYYKIKHNHSLIRGVNNKILRQYALLKEVRLEIKGNDNTVIISNDCRLQNCQISMSGNGHRLEIGESCTIKNTTFWFEDTECKISIGKTTTIEGARLSAAEPNSSISIGFDCMLSQDIGITTTDSHSIIELVSGKRINPPANVIIGDHVWIGAHCEVLKGVSVGNDSIVGIGSIVTRSLPGNSIAVGIPARVTKKNITWSRERLSDYLSGESTAQ